MPDGDNSVAGLQGMGAGGMTAKLNCRIVDGVCRDRHQSGYGRCNSCAHSSMTRPVEARLSTRDYMWLRELCVADKMDVNDAVTQLVNQGIKSVKRRIESLNFS